MYAPLKRVKYTYTKINKKCRVSIHVFDSFTGGYHNLNDGNVVNGNILYLKNGRYIMYSKCFGRVIYSHYFDAFI